MIELLRLAEISSRDMDLISSSQITDVQYILSAIFRKYSIQNSASRTLLSKLNTVLNAL